MTACADRAPIVVAVDTLCVVTTRYHATDGQVDTFLKDKALWESLVDWMAAFNKERDKRCLKPAPGP